MVWKYGGAVREAFELVDLQETNPHFRAMYMPFNTVLLPLWSHGKLLSLTLQ